MAGGGGKSNFLHLNKFVGKGQKKALKNAPSHILNVKDHLNKKKKYHIYNIKFKF